MVNKKRPPIRLVYSKVIHNLFPVTSKEALSKKIPFCPTDRQIRLFSDGPSYPGEKPKPCRSYLLLATISR